MHMLNQDYFTKVTVIKEVWETNKILFKSFMSFTNLGVEDMA